MRQAGTESHAHEFQARCFASLQGFVSFLESAEEKEPPPPKEDEQDADFGAAFGVNADCPIFPGLFSFCRIYAGASVGAPA